MRSLVDAGCDEFLELGPGRVLAGLVRQIDPGDAGLLGRLPGRLDASFADAARPSLALTLRPRRQSRYDMREVTTASASRA